MSDERNDRVRRELLLRGFGFVTPPAAVVRALVEAMREVHYAAGTTVYKEGDESDKAIFVAEGEVQSSTARSEPWVLGNGSVVGVLDINLQRRRARTVVATTDVVAMEIDAEPWLEVLEDNVDYSNATRRMTSSTMHDIMLGLAPDGGVLKPARTRASELMSVRASVVDRLVVLKSTIFFDRASIQAVVELAEACEAVRIPKGELVVAPGAGAHHILVVAGGLVEAERRLSPSLVMRYGEGDVVLGSACFCSALGEYAVRAIEDSVVLKLRQEVIDDVAEDHFDVVRSILRGMAIDRERAMDERARRQAKRPSTVPPKP